MAEFIVIHFNGGTYRVMREDNERLEEQLKKWSNGEKDLTLWGAPIKCEDIISWEIRWEGL